MTAPASVVGQVTAALRERCLNDNWIIDTGHDWDDVRAAAKVAADAAWAAAYPAALRDAAGRFRFTDEDIENAVEAMQEGEWTLVPVAIPRDAAPLGRRERNHRD